MKRRLTNSALRTTACPRHYQLAYLLGLRRDVDHVNLRFGTAVHLGLEHFAQTSNATEAANMAIREFDLSSPAGCVDEYERMKIWVMLTEYFMYWQPLDHIATEMEFDIPLINPETGRASRNWTLAGKIDGVIKIQQPDGRMAVLEHKTTSLDVQDPGSPYWKQLRMDTQISIYLTAARQTFPVETVIYNVIRKPQHKPKAIPTKDEVGFKIVLDADGKRAMKKDGYPYQSANKDKGYVLQTRQETPDEYGARIREIVHAAPQDWFFRQEIPRLQCDLDEAATDLWLTTKMLNFCINKNAFPKRSSQCIGFGTCPYFDLCTGDYDPASGTVPDGYVKLDNVHPELSAEGSETHDAKITTAA